MINKGLSEGNVSLGDYFPQMFKNFTKYVTYYLATLVLVDMCHGIIGCCFASYNCLNYGEEFCSNDYIYCRHLLLLGL